MKRIIYLLLALCLCGTISAQSISLYFPHFAGAEYDFYLIQADKTDTISSGRIGTDGNLSLIIPEKHKDYAGMARWVLKNGGGLDFVVNGENFSVSCVEVIPNDGTIIYKGSAENNFLRQQHFKQQKLLQKINGLQIIVESYKDEPENSFLPLLGTELEKQKSAFESLVEETRGSNLYAAHYRRMMDCYTWQPLYHIYNNDPANEEKYLDDMRHFISEELNMEYLYTSGLWNAIISQTFDLYPDKTDFGNTMVTLLERTQSPKVFEQLATDLVTIVEQYNWTNAGEIIINYLVACERIQYPNVRLEIAFAMQKAKKGSPAPNLSFDKKDLLKTPTILVFYETGCGSCENEMQQLKDNYEILKEKGYKVISVSADHDQSIFENTAKLFPWENKFCDGEGFEGENFKNYGVIGTPTFYIIENGIIQGRHARLQDTGVLN
jgi:Peroxiredoxin